MKQLFVLFSLVSLASCSTFADGTSVWGGGLFIIPWLTGLGSLFFFYKAYAASQSNSTTTTKDGRVDNTGNVPIYQIGWFWFGVVLAVVTIAVVIGVNGSR